jgi:hypothetical protein
VLGLIKLETNHPIGIHLAFHQLFYLKIDGWQTEPVTMNMISFRLLWGWGWGQEESFFREGDFVICFRYVSVQSFR